MEELLENIIKLIKQGKNINEEKLATIIRASNKGIVGRRHNAKKYLMPTYLQIKHNDAVKWNSWKIDNEIEQKLIKIIRVKPTRSASGVATITVITKPWPCGGNCIFCPNDIRMPKSYLSNEPACQRAERNFFDPYLQVAARLKALYEMGHDTDKVEMIVLGGTWNDYTHDYQRWFVARIFEALNDGVYHKPGTDPKVKDIENKYKNIGISNNLETLQKTAHYTQCNIDAQKISYNQAYEEYYSKKSPWTEIEKWQKATWEDVNRQHAINIDSHHRCVGLVFETRPAVVNTENLTFMRRLGATKVQIGVQSLVSENLSMCDRSTSSKTIEKAFALLRQFGFKIHAHFMANLPGANPESDKKDFRELVTNPKFLPDEIKLYPCMLVESARLNKLAKAGHWHAYDEHTLVDVLADDVIATPCYTRISRMMRDISSGDITQGVQKTNLRQMVEIEATKRSSDIQEIRHREISMNKAGSNLELVDYKYQTAATTEHFLQYVTTDNKIMGFCRLSLPNDLQACNLTAMIREVHVYGRVAAIGDSATNAQHRGLGTKLINKACKIAKSAGFHKINVISAIGTRNYYKSRKFSSFSEDGLYQQRRL